MDATYIDCDWLHRIIRLEVEMDVMCTKFIVLEFWESGVVGGGDQLLLITLSLMAICGVS